MDSVVIDDSTDEEELPRRISSSSPATSPPLPNPFVREAGQGDSPREGGSGRQRTPRFFKVFFPELSSNHLDISPAFRPHLFGSLGVGGACTLEGPSGNAWCVNLAWKDGCLPRFEGGWAGFARDHDLRAGEFVVFEYRGGSRFSVIVLDASACDKPSAFLASPREGAKVPDPLLEAGCPTSAGKKRSRGGDGGDTEQRGSGGCQLRKKPRRRQPRRATWDDWSPWSSVKEGNGMKMTLTKKTPAVSKKKAVSNSRKSATVAQDTPGTKFSGAAKTPTTKGWGTMSVPQIVVPIKVKMWAERFSTGKPFFYRVLTKCDCGTEFYLREPATFAKQHLLPTQGEKDPSSVALVLRDPTGEVFDAECYFRRRGYYCLRGGWRKVCEKHRLEELDACVLELVGERELQLHVFRVRRQRCVQQGLLP